MAKEHNKIVNEIMKYLKRVPGCRPTRITPGPSMGGGVSDIIVCLTGKYIAIEVKTLGDKLSPLQERFLLEISIAEGKTLVARYVKDVKDFIESLY